MAMEEPSLFDRSQFVPPAEPAPADEPAGEPRLRRAQRDQIEFHTAALDDLLDENHPVRAIWEAVQELNVSSLLATIRAIEGRVGRDATDPRILLALWVYATIEGVASARALTKLCEYHLAYRWLCGGVTMNHRLLSEFRSHRAAEFDLILSDLVGPLIAAGVVTLKRVAQDGMRTRASAGSSSFRKHPRLQEALKEAEQQIQDLKRLSDEDPQELTNRQRAARQRAAQQRAQRIAQAMQQAKELEKRREEQRLSKERREKQDEARASTTDPEAHKMKFSDGGYRPGYNVQFATDVASGIIVGVDVSTVGSDKGLALPMFEQVVAHYGRRPDDYLIDGGFVKLSDINQLERRGCQVYAPVTNEQKKLQAGQYPYAREKRDTSQTATWRKRMGTELGKSIYKLRSQTAEWVNAQCRNHGLRNFLVRGRQRCLSVTLLHALTHNLLTGVRLKRV
jgi:transposase